MGDIVKTPFTRVFTIEGRAGPANIPDYQGQVRVLSPSWGFGDRTPVREPDPSRYGAFRIIDSIKAERDLPTLPLEARYNFTRDEFLRLARLGCPFDVQIHMGKCQDPRDFNGGWDKILVLEGGDISNWAPSDMGALEQGDEAVITESIDINGLDLYEILQLSLAALAGTQIVMEVVDVTICDSVQCGICGIPSDGCQTVFAIQVATTGSPGLPSELIASRDGGTTIIERNITSLPANRNPTALACVGTRVMVVSNDDCSIHYAVTANILASTETWTKSVLGLTCPAGAPNDLFSLGSTFTWVVGNGGYVYFYNDITGTPVAQSSGGVTTQNLNAIHGYDELNLVAVGAANAVIYTRNGGATWVSVTGPAVGVVLNTVWMRGKNEWFVGTAGGQLWYTRDAGVTWTQKTFSGSGAGSVTDVAFATPTVGYMAHTTATPTGRILRTLDGGQSWYVLPEGTGAIPTNLRINALAACGEDVNIVYGGGVGTGTDGILVKGS